MSLKSSEIASSLATSLRHHLVELHNQTVNDVQGIVGSAETRILEQLITLTTHIQELRARLDVLEARGALPPIAEPAPHDAAEREV